MNLVTVAIHELKMLQRKLQHAYSYTLFASTVMAVHLFRKYFFTILREKEKIQSNYQTKIFTWKKIVIINNS